MPLTAAQTPSTASNSAMPPIPRPRGSVIPPDLEAVLGAAPVHPDLQRSAWRPTVPTAALLSQRALDVAARATAFRASPAEEADDFNGLGAHAGVVVLHQVGAGGALRLSEGGSLRALTVALGSLSERGSSRPALRPGTVRLIPPGITLTLAELSGRDAVVVEVALL